MTPVTLICAGPGPHDPEDGILGTLTVPGAPDPATDGSVCGSPACQPTPPPPTVDPVAELRAAILNATSLADLQATLTEQQ